MNRDDDPENTPDVEIVSEDSVPAAENKTLVLARDVFPSQLPIFPLRGRPLFPKMTVPLIVEDPALRDMLIEAVKRPSKHIGLVLTQEAPPDQPPAEGAPKLCGIGVIAEILRLIQPAPDAPVQVLLTALERMRIVRIAREQPHILAEVEYIRETQMAGNMELKAYSLAVVKAIQELIQLNPLHKEELTLFMSQSNLAEPGRLADIAAALTTSTGAELQEVLETISVRSRLNKVLLLLRKEIDISKLPVRIGKQIEEKLSTQQREFFLREQLKAIKKELGLEKEGKEAEVERFVERVKKLMLTDEARERIDDEIEKLKLIETASPEFTVGRTYLDWLTSLPWGIFTKDAMDIRKAERILNRDHYGLEDVKQRILEFLAVGVLKGRVSGSILCFVGPPGVGNAALGQSIARSMGRNFFRFSVGGIRDEAEIKGHRRTYIGALPGKFIQTLRTCKSANPVIMLDEIDKIGASYRGDPASALLEVLDPEQNREFLDHYLDVRFDLSNVFFICTANQLDTIPRPLLDRMEVITLAGYIQKEKLEIARRYLIPRQLEAHGLKRDQVRIAAAALVRIIDGYAREPGVRGLEKQVKKIMRKAVRRAVDGKMKRMTVNVRDVHGLLGKRVFEDDAYSRQSRVGVVTGLAWTSLGGETLRVEAVKVNTGKPGFKQTGQLGDVMVESSEIAYTYVRAFLDSNPKRREFFLKVFVHLHVPAGATPKDGPSAGITMATALYSLAMGRPIRRGFAMTGELTLTGQVMPIGGLKEKTLAAKRAKIANLIFPAANRKDFEELPSHVRKGLKPHFVGTFAEVVRLCLPARG